jgi:hypothetical protein
MLLVVTVQSEAQEKNSSNISPEPVHLDNTVSVKRLNNSEPILSKRHFEQLGALHGEGDNINGPSVIRIPKWIPRDKRAAPEARYYMYFAHHKGRYIRLAWAEKVEGPWSLYNVGVGIKEGRRGVLDMGNDRLLALDNSLEIVSHIASPDVHVDHNAKRIVMYFHGSLAYQGEKLGGQRSFVATSHWGLDFSNQIVPAALSGSYLRVFEYNGSLQALRGKHHFLPRDNDAPWAIPDEFSFNKGLLWRKSTASMLDFSEIKHDNIQDLAWPDTKIRHLALHQSRDTLFVFFTVKGHAPERIFMTSAKLTQERWFSTKPPRPPTEILRPETIWEGSAIAPIPSKQGMERDLANALRDPYVFADEGNLYLFYAGGGETAIGLARLNLTLP